MSLKAELKVRTITALLLIPVVLLLIYLGKFYFVLLVMIAFGLALWEFLNLYLVKKNLAIYTISLLIIAISGFYSGYPLIILITILLLYLPIPILWSRDYKIKEFALTVFIFLYTIIGAVSALIIREKLGIQGMLFFLFVIWIFDSMAYIAGYFFGRHKLAEKVSPKKTIEGYIYGVLFTIPFGFLLHYLKITPSNNIYFNIGLTIIISILSQVGDLVESAFKREVGVKDSSNLFPGHGGMLDRIDSIIFTAPYFALTTWILGIWR
ncbi:MAG: phosphatidate cytidylyltransferase [bacterium]|nr:phosphatidate cytidylyltransferase [bacterium]